MALINTKVGKGTKIWHPELSNIHGATIGPGCVVHGPVWIGEGVTIGKNCRIQAFSFIPSGVTIGDNVFIGPRVTFTNDKHPPSKGKGWKTTHVFDGAVIGAGAIILPGCNIGEESVVGAGAVVTKLVPRKWTVVGNPARPLDDKRRKR